VQAQLDQRQRFQQLFFPEGLAFDGERLVGTAATAPAFSYLREISAGDERVTNHQRDRDWLAETAGLSGLPASRSGPPDRTK
jgi:hypothetical protein